MRADDVRVLQGIQKNTDMAVKAIRAISPKVYDDDLAVQIAREGMKYSEIYHKATDKLLEHKAKSYQSTGFQDNKSLTCRKIPGVYNTNIIKLGSSNAGILVAARKF